MKKLVLFLIIAFSAVNLSAQNKQKASPYVIALARAFAGDIFLQNGTAYLQPVVKMANTASNSRFFSSAKVPKNVDAPYYRFGIQTMAGFVSNDLTTYNPNITTQPFDTTINKYIDYKITATSPYFSITRLDTAQFIYFVFKNILDSGLKSGSIKLPKDVPTALGKKNNTDIYLPNDTLKKLFRAHPLFQLLALNPQYQWVQDTLLSVIGQFPEKFTLYGGSDINPVMVGIPQFEIGSIYGTEALFRFIPPINLGKTIGDFMFWGIGLKHSISQYFPELDSNDYNIAVQAVYQGTKLTNSVGVTKADLKAHANIFNLNLQFSKSVFDHFDVYSGLSYDYTKISSDYKYYLPVELQWQLGMLESNHYEPSVAADGTVYEGDTDPQTTTLEAKDSNIKFILGGAYKIGNFRISADVSISKIKLISCGIDYTF